MAMFPDLSEFPLLSAYLRAELGEVDAIDTTIHPNDEMLQPAGDPDQQDLDHFLIHYFRAGLSMRSTVEQIVRWRFGGFDGVGSLLDFASGYGRLTRFLLPKLGGKRITVADINPEAVEFQAQQFGVEGLLSFTNPSDFVCEKRFDMIFVASLFTHLPEQTFGAWLERLSSFLNRGGVFVFSVHGGQTFSWTGRAEADGHFVYDPSPQSGHLDVADYGNTYASDDFLREVIGDRSFIRLRRGLMNFQDLCIVVPESNNDFSGLDYDSGADGRLDIVSIANDGTVQLAGWAASRHAPVEGVEIIAGKTRLGAVAPMAQRADVEAFYREPAYLRSGWEFSIKPSDHTVSFDEILMIRAVTRSGRSLLFIGTFGTAAYRSRYGQWVRARHVGLLERLDLEARHRQELDALVKALQQQIDHLTTQKALLEEHAAGLQYQSHVLETRARAMEASRFWKMRNQWFRLKRFMRLTTET